MGPEGNATAQGMTRNGPFQSLALAHLNDRKSVEAPRLERLSVDRLAAIASEATQRQVIQLLPPALELSARRPYDEANGLMDVYMPGRWDATSDLVFMDPIVTGASPGEWTGSVAYVQFNPAAPGTYWVVGHFTGFETTAHLHGPWGDNTAFTAATTDAGVVSALWDGSGGGSLFFTMNFTGTSLGYIQSIQVYPMS